ncbi:MAG: hypothetical protein GXP29_12740 [Planctomycetes bacterium]|nr:hypothetical protein [Planctomycetota bacterium]
MAKSKRNTSNQRRPRQVVQPAFDEPLELIPPTIPRNQAERWGPILLIAALVFVAYLPTLNNKFVSWDDDHYIFDNRQISEPDGIKSIWFDVFTYSNERFRRKSNDKRVSHQYYPIVFTTHWLEYRLFGGDDSKKIAARHQGGKPYKRSMTIEEQIDAGNMGYWGFHLTNTILHMVNVMIMVFLFRAMGLSSWVAWAATILFALHPMQVASVAWAAERKNIISLMFYMLSIMSYIKLRRTGSWWRYVLTIVFFQCAIFSKTVALTLPITLFFTDRLLERKWDAKHIVQSMVRILPLLVLSAISAWTTINVEDRQRFIPLTDDQRPFIPCASLMFYVGKMLLPIDQSPIYRLWNPDPQSFVWVVPMLIVLLLAVAIIAFRKKLGSHFMWAVLMYCVIMGPMLGFKNINYFQFAFVADHYFYHGALGLFLLLGIGADLLRRRFLPESKRFAVSTGVVMVVALMWGVRTYDYSKVWYDSDSFWGRTLSINPDCWPGHFNLGNLRRREAQEATDRKIRNEKYDLAVARHKRVAEINDKIRQPFDQWIGIRQVQRNWKDMLEGAKLGASRFPYIPQYAMAAAKAYAELGDYKNAQKWYRNSVIVASRRGHTKTAIDAYNEAGALAKDNGKLDESASLHIGAAKLALAQANRIMRKDPCAAKNWYTYAGQYLSVAPRTDRSRAEIASLATDINTKGQQAAAKCKK